jgi:GH24 family phage-related lysozyme (muramidase)
MIKLSVLLEQQELQRVLFVGDSSTTSKSSYAQLISKSKKVTSSISAGGDNTSDILDNFKRVNKSKFDVISVMSHFHKNEDPTEAIENLKRLFIAIKELNKKLIVVISPESNDKESIVVNDWLESQTISDEIIKSDNLNTDENTSRDIAKLWISTVLVQNQPITPKKTKSNVVSKPEKDDLQKDLDQVAGDIASEKPKAGISMSKMIQQGAKTLTKIAGAGTAAVASANYADGLEKQAAALVSKFEGFISEPRWDVNNWRVGFGSSTITDKSGAVYKLSSNRSDKPDITVTEEDALRDLTRRLHSEFIPKVMKHANGLNDGTIAALVSVAYNYGSLPNNVVSAMKTGNVKKIAQSVADLSSHNGGINTTRRQKEASYILNSN